MTTAVRITPAAFLAGIIAAAGSLSSAPALAAPAFQLPFPCGQVWSGQTRSNHSPVRSIGVRAAAVLQSAQWDKSAGVDDILQRALLDPEPQVRGAAIAGVTSSANRSAQIKDALLEIASNPHSGREQRATAVFALQNFELDRAEYQIYRDAAEATSDEDGH